MNINLIHILFFTVSGVLSIFQNNAFAVEPGGEQAIQVRGLIQNSEGEPVIGALVQVKNTVQKYYTDYDGYFTIRDLEEGEYIIRVEAFGFEPKDMSINISSGGGDKIEIVLTESNFHIPEITLVAKDDRLFRKTPGSASYIDKKELGLIAPVSGNEVFRRVPGVHVVDEEGLGLRANIGIRGLDPDRSRGVLILEDGIPVALAPYGEPEMYYTPNMDRMEGVEVLKGSGQILFGPQTIGGVINYQSLNPPDEASGFIRLRGGEGGFFSSLISYGDTRENMGYQLNYNRKRADQIGITGFDIHDLNLKFVFDLNSKSELSVKASVYDEISNSTYIGMPQTMFDSGNQNFVHLAPDDRLRVRRYALSLTHHYRFNKNSRLKTTAFGFSTTRNWQRQDFSLNGNNNLKPGNWTGVIWGDESVPNGAIYMRNSSGNRNRHFEVVGLESQFSHQYRIYGQKSEVKIGFRQMYENTTEQRINGSKQDSRTGNLITDEIRSTLASSFYAHNQTKLHKSFSITSGVRIEHMSFDRNILRGPFEIAGTILTRDTSVHNSNTLTQIVPGAGFNWAFDSKSSLYGGIHKGFAPPRLKDAITAVGEVAELGPELSTNYELGVRTVPSAYISVEFTGFYMDFSNQIIPVAESAGGTGAGLINAGRTLHRGIELGIDWNIAQLLKWKKAALIYHTSLSLIDAKFTDDRISEGIEINGLKTPYAPNVLVNSALSLETVNGSGFSIIYQYTGEQFTDLINSVEPHPNGRTGMIPAFNTLDFSVFHKIEKWNTTLSFSIKNLTNERFIVSRRPQGIRLGLPRYISGGLEYRF
jgi:Fe(3+) dicitrate transport protein